MAYRYLASFFKTGQIAVGHKWPVFWSHTVIGRHTENDGHEIVWIGDHVGKALSGKVNAPDLVILDERLRGESGTKPLSEIRARFSKARILVLTADPDAAEAARKRGADRGLQKPALTERLQKALRDILSG